MAVVPKGNRMQNTEETAHAIASVNDNGNVKDDSQPKSETFRSFVEDTSMHGARFLLSKNVFRRGFWTVLLMPCIYQEDRQGERLENAVLMMALGYHDGYRTNYHSDSF